MKRIISFPEQKRKLTLANDSLFRFSVLENDIKDRHLLDNAACENRMKQQPTRIWLSQTDHGSSHASAAGLTTALQQSLRCFALLSFSETRPQSSLLWFFLERKRQPPSERGTQGEVRNCLQRKEDNAIKYEKAHL